MISASLGLAVRTLGSNLEKFPKSASGNILEGLGQHFGPWAFLGSNKCLEKHAFARE